MKKYIRIWVTIKRVTNKIRSACGPIIKGRWERAEIAVICPELDWFFGIWFLVGVQRRGAHVNAPKIGSRVGVFCFWGILGVYAVLRREIKWGNLSLVFFGFLGGDPRGVTEEGGPYVCIWGNFWRYCPLLWMGWPKLRGVHRKGEGFLIKRARVSAN
jgi:hypothetical protein